MTTFKHHKTCIKYIIKHRNDTYLLARVNPPTVCKPSMNLPALDRIAHHSQQYITPDLGLNSTGQRNSRLGKDNKEFAQGNRKDLLSQKPLMPTTHRPSFPIRLLHPMRVHLHYYKSIGQYTSLTLGFNNRLDQKS